MLSYIEISKSNLIHNFHVFRSYLSPKTQLACVIKANAYGHGQNEVAEILEPLTDYFAVDDIEELELLRKVSDKPTLVLGYIPKDQLQDAVRLHGIIGAYDMERLHLLDEIGQKYKEKPIVHIKIDAELGRQGVMISELDRFLTELNELDHIIVDGIYTHFSNIDEIGDLRHTKKQEAMYSHACEVFSKYGYKNLSTHISSTGGILIHETNCPNRLARLGIGLYGLWPVNTMREMFEPKGIVLRSVLRWVSHVAQVKTVPAGYPIGYNLTHVTDKETTIAIVPQGYSDGYDRGLSNKGTVLIKGTRCPVLGRIAMNMFVVDISHIDVVKSEEEVVLLGSQGNETISAEEVAENVDTINYEVVARISPLLSRVVV